MAIPRLSVKVGKKGKAQPHAAYIARLDKYAHRLESGEKLEATGYGNMPAWAADDPLSFWQAADLHERKNGSTYREHEIALPRELSESQRLDLLDDWIKNEIGDNYAYQYAIHNPTSADGLDNPHVHLMFSERCLDGIERGSDQFFKRYNSKAPERGGAKKDNTGKGHTERRENIKDLRNRWQELCNEHLERAGSDVRIDMQSYKTQGKDTIPEKKIGPKAWRNSERKAEVMELRQIKSELVEFVGDAKKFLQRLQTEKKETDSKKRLSPENIEKVYAALVFSEKQKSDKATQNYYKNLNHQRDEAAIAYQTHQKARPVEVDFASKLPFVGYVLMPHQGEKFDAATKVWRETENELKLNLSNAEWRISNRERTKPDLPDIDEIFKEKYPDLHNERERLQGEARRKKAFEEAYEKAKRQHLQQSQAKPKKQKSQGLGYGD